MKSYSQDLRDRVIGAYSSGERNISKLSRVYKISYPTAWDWVNRYRTLGDYSSKQGVGCGRELTFTNKQAILDYIEANPDTDGIQIRDALIPDMPMSTCYDMLKRMGITYKKRAEIQAKV